MLLDAINDPTARGVVGRDGDANAVTEDDTDTIFPHLPSEMGEHRQSRFEGDLEQSTREHFVNGSFEFYVVVATHERGYITSLATLVNGDSKGLASKQRVWMFDIVEEESARARGQRQLEEKRGISGRTESR
jgi:hypothetical protein